MIVLSAILAAFDVSVTYDVAEQPPVAAEEVYVGGSVVPETVTPPDDYVDRGLRDRPGDHRDREPAERGRDPLHLLVVRQQLRRLQRRRRRVRGHDRRRRRRGGGADGGPHPQARQGRARAQALTFIIVFVGGLSSVATDAGYLILIPLGAAAFLSVGRHPLAGLAAAYAGVSAGFAVNILITPLDGMLTEVTNEAIALVDPNKSIDLTANLWFSIASTFFVAIVITIVAERITEPSLGPYDARGQRGRRTPTTTIPAGEARGLR